jgi:hypothetical protein
MSPLDKRIVAGLTVGGHGKRLAEIWSRGDASYGHAADATARLVQERRDAAESARGRLRALRREF